MLDSRLLAVQRAVAANSRRWRRRRGLTQEMLAEKADLGEVHMRAIERGTKNVTLRTIVSIADALEIHPSRLLKDATLEDLRPGRPSSRGRKKNTPGAGR